MDEATRSFYDRWARVYDPVARMTPGVANARRAAVDALALPPGATVVEVGCGTGANLRALRDAVGPDGRVVGVDAARGMLSLARRRAPRDVACVLGDAVRPPICGPVDGVLASFVTGVVGDPRAAVASWWRLLRRGGRLVILEATTSDRPVGRLANPLFRALVRAGAPDRPSGAACALDAAVEAAHDAARERAAVTAERRTLGGFLSTFVAETPS